MILKAEDTCSMTCKIKAGPEAATASLSGFAVFLNPELKYN